MKLFSHKHKKFSTVILSLPFKTKNLSKIMEINITKTEIEQSGQLFANEKIKWENPKVKEISILNTLDGGGPNEDGLFLPSGS